MSYYQNSYSAGDTFIDYSGNKYTVVTGGNTPSTPFDSSNVVNDLIVWGDLELEPVQEGGQGLVDYAPNTSYNVGDIVLYDDKIYRCITAHTSTSTFDDTKWTEISASSSGDGIVIWASNTQYVVNDVVIDSNLIWQCAVAHTSTSTFDESKWICLSGGEISNGYEIVDLWSGTFSFNNSTNGAAPSGSTPMIELSDSIQNYEYLYVVSGVPSSDEEMSSSIITVSEITVGTNCFRIGPVGAGNIYTTASICFYDNTHIYIKYKDTNTWSVGQVKLVRGIRKAKPIVSSGMKYETLWEGEAGSYSGSTDTTINLSNSVNKYRKLGLTLVTLSGSDERIMYYEVNTSDYANLITSGGSGDKLAYGWPGNTSAWFEINSNSTQNQLSIHCGLMKITKVVGISEGVVVPTGVQAARVTLWEGSIGSLSGSGNVSLNLSDSVKNYDKLGLILTAGSNGESGQPRPYYKEIDTSQFDDLIGVTNSLINFSWGYYSYTDYIEFNSSSTYTTLTGNYHATILTKIIGIKYIQPDSYSADEQLIGTWVDGKPLYRKVFTNVTSPFNSGLTSSNSSVKRLYGYAKDGGDTSYLLPLPYADSQAQNYTVSLNYTSTTGNISVYGWRNGSNYSIIIDSIIVEYTKN